MIKNPLVIFSGLAISALAGLLGVTKDRWYQPEPQVATGTASLGETPEVPKSEQPAAPEPVVATKTVEIEPPKSETAAVEPPEAGSKPAEAGGTTPQAQVEPPKPVETTPTAGQSEIQKTEPPQVEAPAAQVAVTPEPPAATTVETQPNVTEVNKAAALDAPGFDTVRVEKGGEAVIAGRAGAGSEVTVKLNGKAIGTAVANADGAFVVVPDQPLPTGSGALTLETKAAGETTATQANEVVAIAVPENQDQQAMVAVVSPDQPTEVLQKPQAAPQPAKPARETQTAAVTPENQQPAKAQPKSEPQSGFPVSLDAVDYDDQGNIVFSGRGRTGAAIRLYVDNQAIGEALMDGRGYWSYSGADQIAPGAHQLRVDEIDEPSGAVSSRVELPFFREEASKVALAMPGTEEAAPPAGNEVAAPIPQPQPAPAAAAPAPQPQVAAVKPEEPAAVPKPQSQPAKPAVSATPEPEIVPPAAAPASEPEVAAAPKPEPQPELAVSATPEPEIAPPAAEPQVAAIPPAEPAAIPKPEAQPEPAVSATPEPEIAPPAAEPQVAAIPPAEPAAAPKPEPQPEPAVSATPEPEIAPRAAEPQVAAVPPAEPAAIPKPEPQPAPPAVAASSEPEAEIAPSAAVPESEPQVAAVQPVAKLKDGRIVIQPGNNLWKLSRVIYGRGMKYTVIYEANRDHIRDPDMIYPGQVFKTPDAVPPVSISPRRRKPLTPEEGGSTVQ